MRRASKRNWPLLVGFLPALTSAVEMRINFSLSVIGTEGSLEGDAVAGTHADHPGCITTSLPVAVRI
jgi:hypothetical protein